MTNGEKFKEAFQTSQVDDCDLNEYGWLPIHDATGIPVEWLVVDKSDDFEEWKLNEDKDCYLRIGDIVDRFKKIDEHYNHSPWNLTQIFSNLNVLLRVYPKDEALEQESIIEKIRAEIEQLPITDTAVRLVTEILDKYKAEVEPQESEDT